MRYCGSNEESQDACIDRMFYHKKTRIGKNKQNMCVLLNIEESMIVRKLLKLCEYTHSDFAKDLIQEEEQKVPNEINETQSYELCISVNKVQYRELINIRYDTCAEDLMQQDGYSTSDLKVKFR